MESQGESASPQPSVVHAQDGSWTSSTPGDASSTLGSPAMQQSLRCPAATSTFSTSTLRPSISMSNLLAAASSDRTNDPALRARFRAPSRTPSPIAVTPPLPRQQAAQSRDRAVQPSHTTDVPFSPTHLSPTGEFAPWSTFVALSESDRSTDGRYSIAEAPGSWGIMAQNLLPSGSSAASHTDQQIYVQHAASDFAGSAESSQGSGRQRPRIVTPSSSAERDLSLHRAAGNTWFTSPGAFTGIPSAASSSSHAHTISSAAPSSRTASSYGFARFRDGSDVETLADSSRRTSAIDEASTEASERIWEEAMEKLESEGDATQGWIPGSKPRSGDSTFPQPQAHQDTSSVNKLASLTTDHADDSSGSRSRRRPRFMDLRTLASRSVARGPTTRPYKAEHHAVPAQPLDDVALIGLHPHAPRARHLDLGTGGSVGATRHEATDDSSSSSAPSHLPLLLHHKTTSPPTLEEQSREQGEQGEQQQQQQRAESSSPPSPSSSSILILDPRPRHLFLQSRIPNSINIVLTRRPATLSTAERVSGTTSFTRYTLVLSFGSKMSKRRFQHIMTSTSASSSSSPSSTSTSRMPSPSPSRKRPVFERSESGSLIPPSALQHSHLSNDSSRMPWSSVTTAVIVPSSDHEQVPFSTLHNIRDSKSTDSLESTSSRSSDHYFDLELDPAPSGTPATSPDVDMHTIKPIEDPHESFGGDDRWTQDHRPWALVDALTQSRVDEDAAEANAVYCSSSASTMDANAKHDQQPPLSRYLASGPEHWNEGDIVADNIAFAERRSSERGSPPRFDHLSLRSPASNPSILDLPVSAEPLAMHLSAPAPSAQFPRSASPVSLLVESPAPSSRVSSPGRPTRPNLARLDTSERVKTLSMSGASSGTAMAASVAIAGVHPGLNFGGPTLSTKPLNYRSTASSPSVSPRSVRSPLRSATVSNPGKEWIVPDVGTNSRTPATSRRPSLGLSLPARRDVHHDTTEFMTSAPPLEKRTRGASDTSGSRFWHNPGASRGSWGWNGGKEGVHRPASLAEYPAQDDADHVGPLQRDPTESMIDSRSSSVSSSSSVYLTLPSSSTESHGAPSFLLKTPPGRGPPTLHSTPYLSPPRGVDGATGEYMPYSAGPSPFSGASSQTVMGFPTAYDDMPPSSALPLHGQSSTAADSSISCILPNFLYLGSDITEMSHVETLRRLGVKRVLNMAIEIDPEAALGEAPSAAAADAADPSDPASTLAPAEKQLYNSLHPAVDLDVHREIVHGFEKYLRIPLRDSVEETGVQAGLLKACRFIDDARLHSAPVYVHCKAGKSRSVTAVMGYLIHALRWPLSRAYAFVAERRDVVSPNIGFVAELMKFEQMELATASGRGSDAGPGAGGEAGAAAGDGPLEGGEMNSSNAQAGAAKSHDSKQRLHETMPSGTLSILASRSASTSGVSRAMQQANPLSPRSVDSPRPLESEAGWQGSAGTPVPSPGPSGALSPASAHTQVPTSTLSPIPPTSPTLSAPDTMAEIETRGADGRYRARRPPADEISLAPGRRATLAGIDSVNTFGSTNQRTG